MGAGETAQDKGTQTYAVIALSGENTLHGSSCDHHAVREEAGVLNTNLITVVAGSAGSSRPI